VSKQHENWIRRRAFTTRMIFIRKFPRHSFGKRVSIGMPPAAGHADSDHCRIMANSSSRPASTFNFQVYLMCYFEIVAGNTSTAVPYLKRGHEAHLTQHWHSLMKAATTQSGLTLINRSSGWGQCSPWQQTERIPYVLPWKDTVHEQQGETQVR